MKVMKNGWRKGLLFLLFGVFITCPALVLRGEQVTLYPYDEVRVVIGFSGVYDILTIHKFWERDSTDPLEFDYYECTKPTAELKSWLNKITAKGGNVIRFFSHGNWQQDIIPITPWKKNLDETYNCDTQTEEEWNSFYWKRLDNLMIELQKRKLTAWIDIWDFCSLKWNSESGKFLYINHPFYKNNSKIVWEEDPTKKEKDTLGLNMFFTTDTSKDPYKTVIKWRKNFEKRLVTKTIKYNPIYSTNEVLDKDYNNFLDDITNYLISQGVQKNRISHSLYPTDIDISDPDKKSTLVEKYGNSLLLAIHGNSVAGEIKSGFFDFGVRVISSDAETNVSSCGASGSENCGINNSKLDKNNKPIWGSKHPLTADQAKASMIMALKLGYCGMELLDRDEYKEGYEEANVNLNNIDCLTNRTDPQGTPLDTLQKMVNVYLENLVTLNIPKGGESLKKEEEIGITWIAPKSKWGTITISLFKGNNDKPVMTIYKGIDSNLNYYKWTIADTIASGSDYRIKISRNYNGRETYLSDFSNNFSISDNPPPNKVVLSDPKDGTIQNKTKIKFIWNKSNPNVKKYWFEILKNGNQSKSKTDLTTTSYEIDDSTFFKEGNSYTWRVCAYNGKWGYWSDIWTFYTPLRAPYLLYPGDGTEVLEPIIMLKWEPVSGTNPAVTKYHLQTWMNGIKKIDDSNIPSSTTSYRVGPFMPNKTYTWHVRAYNGKFWGAWSQTWSFTYVEALN